MFPVEDWPLPIAPILLLPWFLNEIATILLSVLINLLLISERSSVDFWAWKSFSFEFGLVNGLGLVGGLAAFLLD